MDWDEVFQHLESLEQLLSRRADDLASLAAIQQSASALERSTVDETLSDYAKYIHTAAESGQLPAGRCISDTVLGERIERLAAHCRISFVRATLAAARAVSS